MESQNSIWKLFVSRIERISNDVGTSTDLVDTEVPAFNFYRCISDLHLSLPYYCMGICLSVESSSLISWFGGTWSQLQLQTQEIITYMSFICDFVKTCLKKSVSYTSGYRAVKESLSTYGTFAKHQ